MSLLFILDMIGTACGVIRDFLANEVPLILRQEIYESACVLGGILLVILSHIEVPEQLNLLLVACSVILIRVLAIRYNRSLPKDPIQYFFLQPL